MSLHRTLARFRGALVAASLPMMACGDFRQAPDAPASPTGASSSNDPAVQDDPEAGTPADGGRDGSLRDAGGPGDAADDADASRAAVHMTFQGCNVNLTGSVVVVADAKSIAVSRTSQPFSSVQLDLKSLSGSVALSSAQRIATQITINATDPTGTWTNISSQTPDPIGGTLVIRRYSLEDGVLDLEFQGVRLQNLSTMTMCTLNGTLVTTGKSF